MQIGHVAGMFGATRIAILALVTCVLCAAQATAQTLVINTGTDEVGVDPGNQRCETAPGNGIRTLRRAFLETRRIFEAVPSLPPSIVIVLDVPGGVIALGTRIWEFVMEGPNNRPARGSLAIIGAGPSSTVIEVNRSGFLATAAALTMSGLTIRGAAVNAVRASGPGHFDHVTFEDTDGLALYVGSSTTIEACEFNRNLGRAILSYGSLRVRRTILRNNFALFGGAIWAASGTVDLDGVTFVGNHATEFGGAIAMDLHSRLRAVNTTFTDNAAEGSGGALFVENTATATLAHTTFVANAADANRDGVGTGGAIAVNATPALSMVLTHSVVAGSTASTLGPGGWITTPGACSGTLHASAPNLFDLVDCTVTGVAPAIGSANLSPLQDNGGRTATHLPLAGSPAIDAGYTGVCVAADGTALDRDQRGRRRLAGSACDLGATEAGGAIVPMAERFDVNGDGKADLMWRHRATGHIAIWLMDGVAIRDSGILLTTAFGWHLAGTGDVDGDGRADLVWEQEPRGSGAVGVWFMDGTVLKGFRRWQDVPGWSIAGVADANSDGTGDLLWQHTTSGDLALWVMANGTPASGALLPSTSPSGWTIAGFEDLNGDRKADIVWRENPLQGPGTAVWLLDGASILTTGTLPSVPHELWTLAPVRDTDGDGRADLIWRGTNGKNTRWRMDGLTLQAVEFLTPVPDPQWRIR